MPHRHTSAQKHLAKIDPVLRLIMKQTGPFTLKPARKASPFAALAESIAYQQLHGNAAKAIWTRVLALFGGELGTPQQVARISVLKLRQAGLSESKALALKALAKAAYQGIVPTLAEARRLSDEEIIERCITVRGIGRWTVEMFLIFSLGRMDVLPVHDYGVRAGFALAYRKRKLPTPKALRLHGDRWAPYRTIAAWYMWRALEHARKNKA